MSRFPRPLSPHLQIYRPQISSVLSILHRLTGVILLSVPLFLVIWLGIELYPNKCNVLFYSFWQSSLGGSYLILLVYAFFYHLLNGIRHLMWDAGYGFNLKSIDRSGWLVITLSLFFTFLWWI